MSYNSNPAYVSDEFESRKSKDTEMYSIDLNNGKNEKDKDYNPFDNRVVQHPTTNMETLLHLLKGSLGTGILAMPHAFLQSGYVVGIVGTIAVGLICLYCIHLLINAEYELCKRKKVPSMSYPATAKAAFAEGPQMFRKFSHYAPHIVNVFLLVYQLGTCCVYVMFIAKNMRSVLQEYIGDFPLSYYMLAFLLPLILINWIRNLKYLAPFSTIANIITVISFGIIIYYLIANEPTSEEKDAFGTLKNFPLFFGTVLFALEAIGVIMPLENEMKTPEAFGGKFGVLNCGMYTIIFLYVMMGCLGYLTFGGDVEESITLNVKDHILGPIVKLTLALAIYITHALQCYVAVDISWNQYISKKIGKVKRKLMWELLFRTALVVFTLLLAMAIPKLGLFISLFGAFCLSALGIAIPAMIDACTFWNTYTGIRFKAMMTQNVLLILFGLVGLVAGSYTSLEAIVTSFKYPGNETDSS